MENMVPQGAQHSPETHNAGQGSFTGPRALLTEAWHLYKSRIKTITALILLEVAAFAVLFLILFVIGLIGGVAAGSLIAAGAKTGGGAALGVGAVIMLVIFYVAAIILGCLGQLSLLVAIKDSQEGIGAIESIKRAWKKLLPYIWVSALVALVVWGGMMLFVIPGVIFTIWFLFSTFIIIDTEHKGITALLFSKHLAKGKWWAILGRLLYGALVFMGLGLATLIAFIVLGWILGLVLPDVIMVVLAAIAAIVIYVALYLVVVPIALAYQFSIYKAIRSFKANESFVPTKGGRTFIIIFSLLGIVAFIGFMSYSITHPNKKRSGDDDLQKFFQDFDKKSGDNKSGGSDEIEFNPEDFDNLDNPEELQKFLEELQKQSPKAN